MIANYKQDIPTGDQLKFLCIRLMKVVEAGMHCKELLKGRDRALEKLQIQSSLRQSTLST